MNNKYTTWYYSITTSAKARVLDTYTERHHILPKSLGGTDDVENLVDLTAREHFICHWLLTKMTNGEDRYKMLNALRIMRAEKKGQKRYATKITARVYANLKEEYAQLQSIKNTGEGNGMFGKKQTAEARAKIAAANTGDNNGAKNPGVGAKIAASKQGKERPAFSNEWKENLSKNHKSKQPDFDGAIKEETKKKIGDKIRGRKQTQEEKDRRSASVKALGLKREKLLCPHCNKEVAVNGYARWHGDNCKHNNKGTTE